jgi:DNA-binding NarL/FixJ family response regulator
MSSSTDALPVEDPRPLRVVVASHREIVARGLVAILTDHPDRVLAHVAGSLRVVDPEVDVVLFDLALLEEAGPTPLTDLVRTSGGRVIGIAEPASDGAPRRAVETFDLAGAVPANIRGPELLDAIAVVAAGGRLALPVEVPSLLSRREAEIVGLIVEGLSNVEITQRLVISPNTLKSHIRQAYRKIGVSTRAQAVAWAAERQRTGGRG